MPPALTDYTWAFGDSGMVLNTDNINTLPFFDVTSVSGLDTAPIRQSTDEHEGQDGTYVDAQFLSMRTIVISGSLYTDPNDPETVCDLLRAQYGPSAIQPFYFKLPSKLIRFCNAQGAGAKYDIDTLRRIGRTDLQLTLLAGDPYIYDFPAQSQTTAPFITTGIGIGFNMGFNTGFGGTITAPIATVTNNGTHTAYPVIMLQGPLVNPVVQDSISGIAMAPQLVLAASDTLFIDCKNKSMVVNGTFSVRNTYKGIKFFTVPKSTSDSFSLTADSGTGTMTVTLYSTYN